MENHKAHYRVQMVSVPYLPPLDPNGTYQGIQFADGFAYVNWQTLGEHETYVAIQALGQDERFAVKEIPESEYQGASK